MTNHRHFEVIDAAVNQGRTVISAEDSVIIDLAMEALEKGKTATFYLKDALLKEITKRRGESPQGAMAASNLEPIPAEEAARIKADFGIDTEGSSSRETCPECGSVYGAYQFIQQGVKEHGEEAVRAVFSLKDASVLRIHPKQNTICQNCGFEFAAARRPPIVIVIGPHSYLYRDWNHSYACSE